ncbi:MAG: ABC transporter ATP-binding protein [Bacillota bacterium]
MVNILEAKNLSKSYLLDKRQQHVLKNINLKVKKGEFLAVMGPSGSGKSTLLYNISGMDKMTAGEVVFAGEKLSQLQEDQLAELRLKKMGFVFQQINLLKNLGIMDNIIISAYMAGAEKRDKIKERAYQLMKKTGIIELAENEITQVSGGQLQRAAICRALINQPQILFADEPTGALNSSAAEDVMSVLQKINQEGTTIMMVTHDIKVAAQSQRILYMIDGNIEGEYNLDKYSENSDLKERESTLSRWLLNMGF